MIGVIGLVVVGGLFALMVGAAWVPTTLNEEIPNE